MLQNKNFWENSKNEKFRIILADLFSPIVDVKADILDLPFEDESFDVIFCNRFRTYIRRQKAMSEFYRVMKKGGWGILQVPMKNSLEKPTKISRLQTQKKDKNISDNMIMFVGGGMDYFERLKSVGFSVDINFYSQKFFGTRTKRFRIKHPKFTCLNSSFKF